MTKQTLRRDRPLQPPEHGDYLFLFQIGVWLNWSSIAPRLGAGRAVSRGNAQARQKPTRQEHIDNQQAYGPNPIRHI